MLCPSQAYIWVILQGAVGDKVKGVHTCICAKTSYQVLRVDIKVPFSALLLYYIYVPKKFSSCSEVPQDNKHFQLHRCRGCATKKNTETRKFYNCTIPSLSFGSIRLATMYRCGIKGQWRLSTVAVFPCFCSFLSLAECVSLTHASVYRTAETGVLTLLLKAPTSRES